MLNEQTGHIYPGKTDEMCLVAPDDQEGRASDEVQPPERKW